MRFERFGLRFNRFNLRFEKFGTGLEEVCWRFEVGKMTQNTNETRNDLYVLNGKISEKKEETRM